MINLDVIMNRPVSLSCFIRLSWYFDRNLIVKLVVDTNGKIYGEFHQDGYSKSFGTSGNFLEYNFGLAESGLHIYD